MNQYSLLKTIGKGGFAKVKLAKRSDTNEYFAIKIINKQLLKKKIQFFKSASKGNKLFLTFIIIKNKGCIKTDAFQNVLREIAIMKKLQHKNVVKLHEIIDDPDSHELYMSKNYEKNKINAENSIGICKTWTNFGME